MRRIAKTRLESARRKKADWSAVVNSQLKTRGYKGKRKYRKFHRSNAVIRLK